MGWESCREVTSTRSRFVATGWQSFMNIDESEEQP
jgi:hypothetical protein